MQLSGKTALIAGAGRNNGRTIALTFAREGADLVLISRQRREELEGVARSCKELGVNVVSLMADVSKPDQVRSMIAEVYDRVADVDVLVNVVGIRPRHDFWEIGDEEWLDVFAANLHSTFYLARAVAPRMMKRGKGGSIIAMGGVSSLKPVSQRSHVVASKTGLYGLIKSLALELGPHGIRANLLAPSIIENVRLNPEWNPTGGTEVASKAELAEIALGRIGKQQEVADCALFLASDQSSYVTGTYINCTGGRYM